MRKSHNITKYNVKWQFIRSSIKGQQKTIHEKLDIVTNYFNEENSIDAWERVVNYLQGLEMGHRNRNEAAIELIHKKLNYFSQIEKPQLSKEENSFDISHELNEYDFTQRYKLWKDLFRRNKHWLEKGYIQKEINTFMDILYNHFSENSEELAPNYSYEKLKTLRKQALNKDNTHKFFF